MNKIVTILFSLFSLAAVAQPDSVAYTHEFEFTEGIYLNYSQFINNLPIPKASIVSNYPKTQIDFLAEISNQKSISYNDINGNLQRVETVTIWGYSRNHSIYINYLKQLCKVNVIGTLFYFSANVTCSIGVPDPMGMNTNYEETRQFVYDTKIDKFFEFNVKSMEEILMDDNEMHSKFVAMKKREKPDVIFILLRKYNERHPLYIKVK